MAPVCRPVGHTWAPTVTPQGPRSPPCHWPSPRALTKCSEVSGGLGLAGGAVGGLL